MTNIALDVMGGDNCPDINIDGAYDALNMLKDIHIKLVGPEERIEKAIASWDKSLKDRVTIVDANEVISTEESPVKALRA